MENIIYSWEFSDNKNRGKTWYIIALSVVIGIAIWGVFTRQYGLSFIIILLAGVMFFVENNSPEIIEVKINNLGIKIAETFYDFSKIKNYSFMYDKEKAVFLNLTLEKKGLKYINLKVNNKICSDLKEILPNYTEEDKEGEITTFDKIINFLKL